MDMSRYEQINGREALKRLLNGEKVYSCESERYRLDPNGNLYYIPNPTHHENLSFATIKEILSVNWYIPKPFDVRQAMRDKPDEWVGAFHNEEATWCKVGFDTKHMNAIYKPFNSHLPVSTDVPGISFPTPEDLDDCIPIEDVPEEATR